MPLCAAANATSNNANNSAENNCSTVAILQNNTSAVNASAGSNNTNAAGGPNTVLRVIVETLMYPVSLDILHQIFQRFGKVLKIVTFTKNNSFQVSGVSKQLVNSKNENMFNQIYLSFRLSSSIRMPTLHSRPSQYWMARTSTTAAAPCALTTAN